MSGCSSPGRSRRPWVTPPRPPSPWRSTSRRAGSRRALARLDVITLTNGAFAQNCYILVDRDGRDAVMVDPGEEAELFLRRIATERATLKALWLWVSHTDHILGVARVVEATGVPVYLHPDD